MSDGRTSQRNEAQIQSGKIKQESSAYPSWTTWCSPLTVRAARRAAELRGCEGNSRNSYNAHTRTGAAATLPSLIAHLSYPNYGIIDLGRFVQSCTYVTPAASKGPFIHFGWCAEAQLLQLQPAIDHVGLFYRPPRLHLYPTMTPSLAVLNTEIAKLSAVKTLSE